MELTQHASLIDVQIGLNRRHPPDLVLQFIANYTFSVSVYSLVAEQLL